MFSRLGLTRIRSHLAQPTLEPTLETPNQVLLSKNLECYKCLFTSSG